MESAAVPLTITVAAGHFDELALTMQDNVVNMVISVYGLGITVTVYWQAENSANECSENILRISFFY